MEESLTLLRDISLGIVAATVTAYLVRLLHQPAILGYVLSGVLLGGNLGFGLVTSAASTELVSEIGLMLLLFLIGLEINLRELSRMGKPMFTLGLVQFAVCLGLGLVAFRLLGYTNGAGRYDLLYIAIALAMSSTLIVVKLLHDKFETSSAAGRLTIGVLVLQDVWAIVFMAVQPNLRHPQVGGVLRSFGLGLLLAGFTYGASKYLLPRVFRAAAREPELIVLTAVAWCFLVSGLAYGAGLSREMGALMAGVSIAAFPYGSDVATKIAGVRDFFVTLFFVALGLKMPQPDERLVLGAVFAIAVVVLTRLISVVPTAVLLGRGLHTGTVAALNLSQVSEFSLVIVALGREYGHISPAVETLVLTSMLTAAVVGTYLIQFSDALARRIVQGLERLGVRGREAAHGPPGAEEPPARDILVLGCFRETMALLERIAAEAPELRERVLVVDYNPAVREALARLGFAWAYADLASPDTLRHCGASSAAVVLCAVGDTFLKGTTNERLLAHLRRLAPEAVLVMTAEDRQTAGRLLQGGARHVFVPGQLAGEHLFQVLREALQ